MKKAMISAAALAISLTAMGTSAQAGFFFEGLKPFAGDYCRDADPAVTDPLVVPPAFDWENGSPDSNTLGNRPAYEAEGCKSGKYGQGGGRYIKPAPSKPAYKVPQK